MLQILKYVEISVNISKLLEEFDEKAPQDLELFLHYQNFTSGGIYDLEDLGNISEANLVTVFYTITHRIHVWYIYLHLVDLYGKCK